MEQAEREPITAWGDESIRMIGAPPFYMLGVTLLGDLPRNDSVSLTALKPKGSQKLHWRDMNVGLQRKSLIALADIERIDLVVIASPLAGKKQERARRKCLESLLPTLESRGVERLVLESRKPTTDKLDMDYVEYARGSRLIRSIRIDHVEGADDPRLWIADQVLGAMGDYLTKTGGWQHWQKEWEELSQHVERIDVAL